MLFTGEEPVLMWISVSRPEYITYTEMVKSRRASEKNPMTPQDRKSDISARSSQLKEESLYEMDAY